MKCKMELKLRDELEASSFDIGYYERYAMKHWLIDDEDLKQMYKTGEIHLWCEILNNDENQQPPKKKEGRRQDKEEKVDSVLNELCDKHKETCS